ncbi:MAG: type II toxin-antitoxin system VapC family toxin [Micrococcales bacterium]|nr:type II toxin-antitoxin system VapC family toxin [Micrococcales bacterium]
MIVLADTHLILWSQYEPERLPAEARLLLEDPANDPVVSAASMWEIAIKAALGRSDFQVDPGLLRRELLLGGWTELAISGDHGVAAGELPPIHRDPFDRMLIAQARAAGAVLVTSDRRLADYGAPVRLIALDG